MADVLIIGKNGTLGSEFMRLYGPHAVGVDYSEVDITDQAAINNKITEVRPAVIINCAAYNAVDKAEQEPDIANRINGYAVGYIAKAAKEVGAVTVHYSTNYVFDGTKQEGYNEDDEPSPQSAYGRSKLLGETELRANAGEHYLIRTAWLYGRAGSGRGAKINYIERILQLAGEKDVLEGVNDQYGQPTWAHDLALATQALVEQKKPSGIYHLTNSGNATWYTWAKEILRLKQLSNELLQNQMSNFGASGHTAPRPQYGILNNTKIAPLRPWQDALQEYLLTT